mmetsp:Transcript_43431/g.120075  ORF Transcript_43431/g.120075 Transcript_43431/m.120075 type:complete len:143 (+) Transcript_43431:1-429(+)
MDFNATCESLVGDEADNSAYSSVPSDVTWIVRPRGADASTAACPAPPIAPCQIPTVPPPPASPPALPSPPPPSAPQEVGGGGYAGWQMVTTGVGGVVLGAALASLLAQTVGGRWRKPLLEPMLPSGGGASTILSTPGSRHAL